MASGNETEEKEHERITVDHYAHLFLLWSAAAYAWQTYGFWTGALTAVGLYAVVGLTNLVIMIASSVENPLKFIRYNRWAWLTVVWVILIISNVETVQV